MQQRLFWQSPPGTEQQSLGALQVSPRLLQQVPPLQLIGAQQSVDRLQEFPTP